MYVDVLLQRQVFHSQYFGDALSPHSDSVCLKGIVAALFECYLSEFRNTMKPPCVFFYFWPETLQISLFRLEFTLLSNGSISQTLAWLNVVKSLRQILLGCGNLLSKFTGFCFQSSIPFIYCFDLILDSRCLQNIFLLLIYLIINHLFNFVGFLLEPSYCQCERISNTKL